ncbi:MAG: hypothetical protein JWO06_1542 [Bacteroidota bacterium]|nr:hypothetical protein [Bacteroidota bacterium]
MKTYFTRSFLAVLCSVSLSCFAQTIEDKGEGGPNPASANDANHPCISTEEYKVIEQRCAENRQLLGLTTPRSTAVTALGWPLQAAGNLPDCSFYFISAGVDHDTTTGILDYNCGSRTYDGHAGTDIAIFPFPFYKMDSNQVQVIAAAAGTILYKSDGNFDKNCAGNNLTANAIIITHADGSQTHYWHMKSGSVTTKSVGQTVAAGEYLGIVGSSGSSTGPHLHFEVWNGTTASSLIDPFAGSCNTWNANTWWATQKPYTEPEAVKVSVNTTDIVLPACPATETTNESSSYTIPFQGLGLSPGYAKFYMYLRDETSGLVANLSILNPNGTTFNSWTRTSTNNYHASYAGWSKLLPTAPGTYTFKASYNGIDCSTQFNILGPLAIDEATDHSFNIFPNPASSNITISLNENISGGELTITDVAGRRITSQQLSAGSIQLSTEKFATGLYFVTVESAGQVVTQKLVISHE